MKRMTKIWLEIEFDGLDLDDVNRVEIVAQQYKDGGVRKTALWTADGTGDCLRGSGSESNRIYMPWSREETAAFRRDATFWLDVRPVKISEGIEVDVETDPVELLMKDSLFLAGDFELEEEAT